MKETVLCILAITGVVIVSIIMFALAVFGIICIGSIQHHGSGEMNAYITKVSKYGDRVFIEAKDSQESSNTYNGCVASNEEEKFKNIIGEKVKIEWDGVFSLSPFWTECPAPVRIKEFLGGENE